jgi:predicted O-methyltransferase YrrM
VNEFQVDGATFAIDFQADSTPDRLCICKAQPLVDATRALIAREQPRTIVELGIARGGSTALLAVLAKPTTLVAIELGHEPPGLGEFLRRRGIDGQVSCHYGIDQADPVVGEIVDTELGGEPLDLVIDDASHLLAETRASFEMLFPRLRPGGLYVVEDWAAHHTYARMAATIAAQDAVHGPRPHPHLAKVAASLSIEQRGCEPITRLLTELTLARAYSGDAVAEITVDGDWFTVRRGPADLTGFRLVDWYDDHFGQVESARIPPHS